MEKTGFRIYLRQCLSQKQQARPGYSLRAFARDLELSPSELSLILSGRRNPSLETLRKALTLTRAPEDLQKKLQEEWTDSRRRRIQRKPRIAGITPELQVALGHMAIYGSSYTLTILELLRIKPFRGQKLTSSLIRRLALATGAPEAGIRESIRKLKECGFLTDHEAGGQSPVRGVVLYPGGVPSASIRSYHQHLLGRCQASIDDRPLTERINDAVQVPIRKASLGEIRREVQAFHAQLIKKFAAADGEGDDVLLLTAAGTLTLPSKQETSE